MPKAKKLASLIKKLLKFLGFISKNNEGNYQCDCEQLNKMLDPYCKIDVRTYLLQRLE